MTNRSFFLVLRYGNVKRKLSLPPTKFQRHQWSMSYAHVTGVSVVVEFVDDSTVLSMNVPQQPYVVYVLASMQSLTF